MKNPGNIKAGTKEHEAIVNYATHLAERFDIALPAILGQLLKLDDALCKVADSEIGMSALIIEVKK